MTNLNKKAFGGLLWLLIVVAASLFLPAWTFDYWQAWIFLVVFSTAVLAITIHLAKKDPKLLERRVNAGPGAEKEKTQKIIQFIASIAFVVVFVLSSVDHRFAWSSVSPEAVVAGDALVALGLLAVFLVFRENTIYLRNYRSRHRAKGYFNGAIRACAPSDVRRGHCHAVRSAPRARLLLRIVGNHSDRACDRVEASRRGKIPRKEPAGLLGISRQGRVSFDAVRLVGRGHLGLASLALGSTSVAPMQICLD